MIKNANKISIIGGAGTGKTTLSNNLGKELKLPVYHIDAIQHLENWVERDKDERDKMILEKVSKEKLIDMVYQLSELENNIKWSTQKTIMFQSGIIKICMNQN